MWGIIPAAGRLSFLLFPVDQPQFFDATVLDESNAVREIRVKQSDSVSHWIWRAFKMPGRAFHELHQLWSRRQYRDEYIGTLVNAYLAQGGQAIGVKAGTAYVDVGTVHGYRSAISLLREAEHIEGLHLARSGIGAARSEAAVFGKTRTKTQ